ncbi:hypothetical protein OF83DRAFT_1175345 [Amylostereum chailletii]|nr:hypothetical protein OF83DRAFT_1175345 [Amylostereum chailletii]
MPNESVISTSPSMFSNQDILLEIFHALKRVWPYEENIRRHPQLGPPVGPQYELGWIKVTHVCAQWRKLALSQGALWADIDYTSAPNKLAKDMLKRAKNAPLKFTICLEQDACGRRMARYWNALKSALTKRRVAVMRSLDVTCPLSIEPELHQHNIGDVLSLFTHVFSNLEALTLAQDGSLSAVFLPARTIASHMPSLKRLHLTGCSLHIEESDLKTPLFSSLIYFRTDCFDLSDDDESAPPVPPESLTNSFPMACMPKLEILEILDDFPLLHIAEHSGQDSSRQNIPPVRLPQSLKQLCLYGDMLADRCAALAIHLVTHPSTRVRITLNDSADLHHSRLRVLLGAYERSPAWLRLHLRDNGLELLTEACLWTTHASHAPAIPYTLCDPACGPPNGELAFEVEEGRNPCKGFDLTKLKNLDVVFTKESDRGGKGLRFPKWSTMFRNARAVESIEVGNLYTAFSLLEEVVALRRDEVQDGHVLFPAFERLVFIEQDETTLIPHLKHSGDDKLDMDKLAALIQELQEVGGSLRSICLPERFSTESWVAKVRDSGILVSFHQYLRPKYSPFGF